MKLERKRYPWTPKATINEQRQTKEDNSFYHTQAWRRTRKVHLINEPLCRECGAPAEMVDHITPIRLGGAELDDSNLQSLCNKCHAIKSGKERWEKKTKK